MPIENNSITNYFNTEARKQECKRKHKTGASGIGRKQWRIGGIGEGQRWIPNQNDNIIASTAAEATFLGTPETHTTIWIPEAILTKTGMENKLPSCSWKEVCIQSTPVYKTQLGTTQGTNAFNSNIEVLALEGKKTKTHKPKTPIKIQSTATPVFSSHSFIYHVQINGPNLIMKHN